MATNYINFRNYPQVVNITGGNKILLHSTDFSNKYTNMKNLKHGYLPISVTNMSNIYNGCTNLTGSPVCGNKVTDMSNAYLRCTNITGSPVCGNNVTNMSSTYSYCRYLTGNPVCGDNVTNMSATYRYCINLTGSPVCGNKVINMFQTYYNCNKLTGSPVCGSNVTIMDNTYSNCINLTGSPVCGNKVTDMRNTYHSCTNLYGNMYMYSDNVSIMSGCFFGRNNSKVLNIFVNGNSMSLSTCMDNARSIVGGPVKWGKIPPFPNAFYTSGYFNAEYNIYIYAVNNVVQVAKNNGDYELTTDAEIEAALNKDFTYTKYSNGIYEITGWKETLNGVSSTICRVPNSRRIMI